MIKFNQNLIPGLLKTCTLGYDGKGQFKINSLKDINEGINFNNEYILEKVIDLKKEISIIITRFGHQKYEIYEPIENIHEDQILKNSKIPANITEETSIKAQSNAKLIAEKLDYVGTMCVEYFVDQTNILLVNEIAPRVHNSGHLTINAFNISQFENHIRAVCGFKNEKVKKIANAEMVNILGKEIEEYTKHVLPSIDSKHKTKLQNNIFAKSLNINKNYTCDDELILSRKLVLECISYKRAENYEAWINLGWVLRNIDYRLLETWIEFSKIGTAYIEGECQQLWNKMRKDNMGLGTLRWWAKLDNGIKY